jgi:superfamily II DNA or RNA helicase
LKIFIKNNIKLSNIPLELRQILVRRLTIPNPKWIENNRMGRWNGKTPENLCFYRETNDDGLILPRGFARQLILLCRKKGVDYEIDDNRRSLSPVEFNFTGRLKSFQQTAVDTMLKKDFGTLNAPTGAGKTVMALYMIARRKQPALVLVHTKNLAFQWVDRIENFLNIPADKIGFIGGGKQSIGKEITVALVQSIYKRTDAVIPCIGHLIVDECHRTPSRTFTEAVSAFDSKYALGLSATLFRRDKLSKLIFWHLGDTHHQVDKSRLIENGDILSAEVIIRKTEFKPFYDPAREYTKMISELVSDDQRNRLIASDVAEEVRRGKGVCLILSDRKNHCETLQALLRYKFKIFSELLTGDIGNTRRLEIMGRLNRGEIKVLVATGQLIGEGFDCKNLSTLFLATPVRFSGRVIQYLGRILRPAPGKEKARVFDYVDIHVDVLKAAAHARQGVYGIDSNPWNPDKHANHVDTNHTP